MATYWVRPVGSNTPVAPYDTYTKAANSLSTILALALTGSNTILIVNGSYDVASILNISDAKYSSLLITGSNSLGTALTDPSGVVLGGASPSTLFYVSGGTIPVGTQIKNMTLSVNGSARKAFRCDSATTDWVLENLILTPTADTGVQLVNSFTNAANFKMKNVRCRAGNTTYAGTEFKGSSSGLIQYSVFENANGDNAWPYGGLNMQQSGIIVLTNSVINGGIASAISMAGSGTTTVRNSLLIGAGTGVVTRSAGTCDVDYCTVVAGSKSPKGHYLGAGVTDGGHNILGPSKMIKDAGRKGFVIPAVDDGNITQVNYVDALEQKLTPYGMKMTWAYYGHPGTDFDVTIEGPDRQLLRDIIQRGTVEVASHTWSHAAVSSAITTYGTLTHTAGTTKTYKIDLTNHVFAVYVDGTTLTVNLPTDNMMTLHDALLDIQQTDPGWEFAFSYGGDWTHFASLVDTGGFVPISTALLFNKSSATAPFYINEITGYKATLSGWVNALGDVIDPQTGAVYTPNSFIEPGGSQDATSRQAVLNAGFLGSRPILTNTQNLQSVDLFMTIANIHTGFLGSTDAETIINMNSIAFSAAINGEIILLLSHDDTEIPSAKWQVILDALKPWHDAGFIEVTSSQIAYSRLRQLPWTYNSTTGISTRTYTDYPDYTATAYNSGVAITGVHDQSTPATDFNGNIVHFADTPNIGPYDGRTTKAVTTDYTPTGYSVRGTEAEPAIINLSADDLSVNLSGLTADEYIQVKSGSKRVKGFVSKGSNQYLKSSGGSRGGSFGF
jgi:hypothetical protein